ncbi:MAG: phosphoribosylformylglycinamidine synthase subunit PurL [Anaerolineaceae bacterium]|nr:phosphoribosylformylglycinamidine synthase subunit PurL [Anaerolineaceae bacterium]
MTEKSPLTYEIEVFPRPPLQDAIGQSALARAGDLHLKGIDDVASSRVFFLLFPEGHTDAGGAERIARALLADPVSELFRLRAGRGKWSADAPPHVKGRKALLVTRKPGVMDPVAASLVTAAADLGLDIEAAHTGTRYYVKGKVAGETLEKLKWRVLANDCIEDVLTEQTPFEFREGRPYEFQKREIPIRELSDADLEHLSRHSHLFLSLAEMKTIGDYYRDLGREPTDIELETLAQTWSEHCVHKTMKGYIEYNGTETIDNLLKSTIARATFELDRPWCVSVFEDNAGIVRFDDRHNVCFKVETHNHPSAIEPYGGAATGIGGCIRDPMGTGLGARPIMNTDVFCFAPPDTDPDTLPQGVLHPKRVMRGVVGGVRDYGNRMGIPTANGALYFDPRYLGNPLVYCGVVGIMPRDKSFKNPAAGDLVVVVGGRTGRDGIHGATFSSAELTETSDSEFSHAVQIGDAITEKRMLDTLLVARDRGLYSAITDCGAGGLSSSVGEMGAELGARVHLERVPLKYAGLTHTEIWISEAQERMTIAVPPEHRDEIMELFESENVEATVIGEFTDTRQLELFYDGRKVGQLDMDFLHNGVPRQRRIATWTPAEHDQPEPVEKDDFGPDLHGILKSWNVCSKHWIIRQYDHEVQGTSIVKPLVGPGQDGPGDAAVIAPVYGSTRGLAVANGLNPKYSDIDPYAMAASAIDEALRNVVAVGGDPSQTAILDNFCWGNCEKPDRLGGLVRAAKACYDVASAYGTPFISGKDSLNNEYQTAQGTIAIPATLLISALAIVPDVRLCVTSDLKEAGNVLYLVGLTRDELGGSHYWALRGAIGRRAPLPDLETAPKTFVALHKAITAGLVRSCHDLSEGGLAVAAAEMAFAGRLGAEIVLSKVPRDDSVVRDEQILFSESNSRFLVEVPRLDAAKFERLLYGVIRSQIGGVTASGRLVAVGLGGKPVIDESIDDLRESWLRPLDW